MTAPLLTSSFDSSPVEPLFGYRPRLPIAPRTQRPLNRANVEKLRDRLNAHSSHAANDISPMWGQLLEMTPQGIVVFSRSLKPVYWNQKAKNLCQALTGEGVAEGVLPLAVSEACYGVMRDNHAIHSSLVVECPTSTGHLVRVSARMLESTDANERESRLPSLTTTPGLIAVFLENCHEVMQQEAKIQQQKYDLTDREAEIWMLLRQELTYQEIAQRLQISLNTVKTHVKNVYAKRRGGQGKEKYWC
ncbi:MAG: helix-turn-helix transcriptional regulator [Leptolyngbyaceae cyanobacterium bins.302]|nr:helix-turn-helix transcriptional regulator [Leptolyngbyaceae cyanobacterium bins.302]